jgi:hypothetical protein
MHPVGGGISISLRYILLVMTGTFFPLPLSSSFHKEGCHANSAVRTRKDKLRSAERTRKIDKDLLKRTRKESIFS